MLLQGRSIDGAGGVEQSHMASRRTLFRWKLEFQGYADFQRRDLPRRRSTAAMPPAVVQPLEQMLDADPALYYGELSVDLASRYGRFYSEECCRTWVVAREVDGGLEYSNTRMKKLASQRCIEEMAAYMGVLPWLNSLKRGTICVTDESHTFGDTHQRKMGKGPRGHGVTVSQPFGGNTAPRCWRSRTSAGSSRPPACSPPRTSTLNVRLAPLPCTASPCAPIATRLTTRLAVYLYYLGIYVKPSLNRYGSGLGNEVVLLDNCVLHHEQTIADFFEQDCGVRLVYLPRYCAYFSPIEPAFDSWKSNAREMWRQDPGAGVKAAYRAAARGASQGHAWALPQLRLARPRAGRGGGLHRGPGASRCHVARGSI